jgi:hypothetical protein
MNNLTRNEFDDSFVGKFFTTSGFDNLTSSQKTDIVRQGTRMTMMTIAMCVIFFTSMVVNVAGNSLLLIAIRTTPNLWTKTNKILANLAVADLISGVDTAVYLTWSLRVYVFGIPCDYNVLETALMPLFHWPPYASEMSMVIVAIDRYVAICHPLIYEERITDAVVHRMIAAVWISAGVVSTSYWFWLIDRDKVKCTAVPNIIPDKFNFIELWVNLLVTTFVVIVYLLILRVARRHHRQLRSCDVPVQPTSKLSTNGGGTMTELKAVPHAMHDNDQEVDSTGVRRTERRRRRRREFKALYLTAVITGTFVVLWMPRKLGRFLQLSGVTQPFVADLLNFGGAFGMFNSSFNWILYGIVNNTYRKAFRRLLRIGC